MKRNRTTFCTDITGSIDDAGFEDVLGESHKYAGMTKIYDIEQSMPGVKVLECRNCVGDTHFNLKVEANSEDHNTIIDELKNTIVYIVDGSTNFIIDHTSEGNILSLALTIDSDD